MRHVSRRSPRTARDRGRALAPRPAPSRIEDWIGLRLSATTPRSSRRPHRPHPDALGERCATRNALTASLALAPSTPTTTPPSGSRAYAPPPAGPKQSSLHRHHRGWEVRSPPSIAATPATSRPSRARAVPPRPRAGSRQHGRRRGRGASSWDDRDGAQGRRRSRPTIVALAEGPALLACVASARGRVAGGRIGSSTRARRRDRTPRAAGRAPRAQSGSIEDVGCGEEEAARAAHAPWSGRALPDGSRDRGDCQRRTRDGAPPPSGLSDESWHVAVRRYKTHGRIERDHHLLSPCSSRARIPRGSAGAPPPRRPRHRWWTDRASSASRWAIRVGNNVRASVAAVAQRACSIARVAPCGGPRRAPTAAPGRVGPPRRPLPRPGRRGPEVRLERTRRPMTLSRLCDPCALAVHASSWPRGEVGEAGPERDRSHAEASER